MTCREDPPFEHPAVHQYQPLQKQLKYLHMLPISHFWLECSGSEVICILNSRTLGIYLKSPMGLSYQRFQIGTFLPSYSIEQGFFLHLVLPGLDQKASAWYPVYFIQGVIVAWGLIWSCSFRSLHREGIQSNFNLFYSTTRTYRLGLKYSSLSVVNFLKY